MIGLNWLCAVFSPSRLRLGRMALLTVSLCLVLGGVSHAQEQPSDDKESKNQLKVKAGKHKKKREVGKETNATLNALTGGGSGWRLQATATHIPRLRRDQEDTTDFLFRGDYTLNRKHRFRVQQFFTKSYGKYRSEYEFRPSDTAVAHFYRPNIETFKDLGLGFLWRNQVTLPISNDSVRDDLITRFQTSAIFTKPFFKGKLIAFAVPYGIYHWHEFKTSASGRRLPWYSLGASVATLYFITSKLTFYSGVLYDFDATRPSQFDQNQQAQQNSGTYRFDLDLSYQVDAHWTGSLSYFQGANYTRDGRYEVAFFDDQESRVSFGVTYIY